LKIALVTETFLPQINGIVRTLERLIRHLEDAGHEVLVIAMGGGPTHYSRSTVVRIPGERFVLYPELYLALPENWLLRQLVCLPPIQVLASILMSVLVTHNQAVDKALRDFKPDLVHMVSPATLCAMAYDYVRSERVPCLATYHTDIAGYTHKYRVPFLKTVIDLFTSVVYRRAQRVLAPSPSSKLQLERDCKLNDVRIFSRGVDTVLFKHRDNLDASQRRALQLELGLDPDCITILYAGRLAGEKSIPVLVRDFKDLSDAGHPVQLLLVGDGPVRSELEQELRRYPAVFAGFRQGDDYARMLQLADIFAFPSRTETFGQVVQEAMATALPVIVFDAPGVRDLIRDGQTGYVVRGHSMRAELERLIGDANLRTTLGNAAHGEVQNRSWQQVLSGLVGDYEHLVAAA